MSGAPKLSFLTFYSLDPQVTATFYGEFGIGFQSEKHGKGPLHYSFESNGLIVEIYPATEHTKQRQTATLGFEVNDADEAAQIAARNDYEILALPRETSLGKRVIVADPDGRHVFLYSKIPETDG